MGISRNLQIEIKKELIEAITNKLNNWDFSKKSNNPFVDLIFGKYSNVKTFIHGTATMLGSKYESIAKKIADANPHYTVAKKNKI